MKIKYVLVLIGLLITFVGCQSKETVDEDKIKDLDFTVVEDEDLPEIVANKIVEEKRESFKFSYSDGAFLYIAVGYGEQPTGGYSIQVEDVYLTEKYIIVDTKLIGPSEEDLVATALTYPYIVIKTEDYQLPVCYK